MILSSVLEAGWLVIDQRSLTALGSFQAGVVVVVLLSIGVGLIAEIVMFAAPVADILDIVHQSLGAVLVGSVLVVMPIRYPEQPRMLIHEVAGVVCGTGLIIVGARLVGIV